MRFFFRLFAGLCILGMLASCQPSVTVRIPKCPAPQVKEEVRENMAKMKSRFQAIALDHIYQFDLLLRIEAEKIGWDWRMLASIIYQESHFKPDLVNEKGAFGLMQLMPVTMAKYGINYNSTIEEQLEVAGKLLLHFDRELPESIIDSLERDNFILASYNAGMGTILEARLRAERNGKNPNIWIDNVELYSPRQTYYFVREIRKRYSNYQILIE